MTEAMSPLRTAAIAVRQQLDDALPTLPPVVAAALALKIADVVLKALSAPAAEEAGT